MGHEHRIMARSFIAFGLLTILFGIGGAFFWSSQAMIAGAVIAIGHVEVDQRQQVVQHEDGGVVETIFVDDGDLVQAGDLLIRLDGTLLRTEQNYLNTEWLELSTRRARLEAERDGSARITFDPMIEHVGGAENETMAALIAAQINLFETRRESDQQSLAQLEKRRDQIAAQIRGISAQSDAVDTQRDLIVEELAGQQALFEQGLAQMGRVLALERELARLNGQGGELAAAIAQAEGRITEIEIETLRLVTTRREDAISTLRDIRVRMSALAAKRIVLAEQISRLDIRAPVSGRIFDRQIHAPRAVLRPAAPILHIVPQDRPLIISARLPVADIDQSFVGQDALIRLSAFDQRDTPELIGRVTRISADALTDEVSQMRYYRAEIVLPDSERARLPDAQKLIPGMPVEAFLRTDDRTVISFLIKPLQDYFNRAFREG